MNELKTYGISPEQVKRIILTHGDVDHIGNVNKIREATKCEVCADSLEIPYLEKQKKYNRIKGFLKALLHIGKVLNVKPFVDNKIGNIEIIKTPGHTPGHVCFKFGKIVFLGDLVGEKNEQLFTLKEKMTFDKTQLLDSIKNMNFSDVDLLCPAHGNIINTFPA
jgi:glyoxylase-like metal-dependent hydrolase (beta-lactamase superfamily II)